MLLLDSTPKFSWQTFLKTPSTQALLPLISSETELDDAYQWLLHLVDVHHLDIHWRLPTDWKDYRTQLQAHIFSQEYRFHTPHVITQQQNSLLLWSLRDTLILRAMAQVFSKNLPNHPQLWEHDQKDSRGANIAQQLFGSIQQYTQAYPQAYAYVAHLELNPSNRQQNRGLCKLIGQHISLESQLQHLLYSYLSQTHALSHRDTLFDPLAPLLSQLLLQSLDGYMQHSRYFYARHFGEWLFLAQDKAHLENAIYHANRHLKKQGLHLYVSPRVVNRLSWGVSFLGFNFNENQFEPVTLAHEKRDQHLLICYQQRVEEHDIQHYLSCWQRWVNAGLDNCPGMDEKTIFKTRRHSKLPYRLQRFLLWFAWVRIPLFIALTLGSGIFLGDFLMEMVDDTLDLAEQFEHFMNPRYW